MVGKWIEVVRLAFEGARFHDHALDLSAIGELGQFQQLVAETAKSLWRAANSERERLPKRFEDRIRLCLRRVDEGSAVAPLEVYVEQPEGPELFEPEPQEAIEAVDLAYRVFRAAELDEPLPENLPRTLVGDYAHFGQGLGTDEAMKVAPIGKLPARVTQTSRARLVALCETPHEDQVEMLGEVLEADVRQGRFQLWTDERTCVSVAFSPEQEGEVTRALREHHTLRLQVRGRGEFSAQGKPIRVTQVAEISLLPAGLVPYDSEARPIEDILVELAAEVPAEEWSQLPPDLTDDIDHYLYGTPKQ
jgi:hypothetical protein